MSAATEPRWYSVDNRGMATLCADQADAENVAIESDIEWPRQAPHQAVQLVELSGLEKERAARIEAQQRLADMQELAAKSGLAHRMAVQEAVREALQDAQKACEHLAAPAACNGVEQSLWDVATMACAESVGKIGTQ